MDNEIMSLLDSVKQKTGIDVRIYLENGDDGYSTVPGETIRRADEKIYGVSENKEKNKTYFRFRHRADEYVGYVDSIGDNGERIASLISIVLENSGGREVPTSKKEAMKNVVLGDCNSLQTQKYMRKFGIPNLPCSVYVCYVQDGSLSDIINFLENFKTSTYDLVVAVDEISCAYVRFNDGTAQENEFQSLTDYAYLMAQSIEEELGLKIKIGVGGTTQSFADSAVSYKQAATAVRMSGLFEMKTGVATYKDYVFIKLLEELPKYKLEEFLSVLSEPDTKTVFSDSEMLETASEFLKANLNVSEASRNLFMHRNTLMYRLDKIEKATGLDIRKFQDAMTFRLMMILDKLIE